MTIKKTFKNLLSNKLVKKLAFWANDEEEVKIAILRLEGVIGSVGLKNGLTINHLDEYIEKLFKTRNIKAVALIINSPGGSPVQSALIAERIRKFADEKELPVFSFVEDVAASGGYWLACAGDEIYADEASVIGSIGVISQGFGFVELIKKYGIERRVYTQGKNKAMLDPFQKEDPESVEHLKNLQRDVHHAFIRMVNERRSEKLVGDEDELFSGAFWSGIQAKSYGLIDDIGNIHSVLKEKYGDKVKIIPIKTEKQGIRKLLGISFSGNSSPTINTDISANIGRGMISAAEERLMWNKYGL